MNECPVGIYLSDKDKSGTSFVLGKSSLKDPGITTEKLFEFQKAFLTNKFSAETEGHACFYISNLMNYNVSSFIPMLKKKSCATLGISSSFIGLSFDHRVVEGSYVASFLNELKKIVES